MASLLCPLPFLLDICIWINWQEVEWGQWRSIVSVHWIVEYKGEKRGETLYPSVQPSVLRMLNVQSRASSSTVDIESLCAEVVYYSLPRKGVTQELPHISLIHSSIVIMSTKAAKWMKGQLKECSRCVPMSHHCTTAHITTALYHLQLPLSTGTCWDPLQVSKLKQNTRSARDRLRWRPQTTSANCR